MLRLYYSNRWERLGERLAQNVRAAQAAGHPLDPIPIVVSNPAQAAYVRQVIAKTTGIAANLDVTYFRSLVARGLSPGYRLADVDVFHSLLIDVLVSPEILSVPTLAPAREYLAAAGADPHARDLRVHQLAFELAQRFDAYDLDRPDFWSRWRQEGNANHPVERWQKALWTHLEPGRQAARVILLSEALEHLAPDYVWPPQLFLFGVSVTAPAALKLVSKLAEASELHLFMPNPCLEFWEDISSRQDWLKDRLVPRRGPRSPDPDDPFALQQADTPLLSLWGRPAREAVRLLDELSGCDFISCFETPEDTPTVLTRLQKDLLLREPEHPTPVFEGPDSSLVAWAAPSIRREVEQLAERIWFEVQQSADDPDPLRFSDCAVVLAGRDAELYRAHVTAVFAEHHGIPHHLLDLPLSTSSPILEALELFLALPRSAFRREDLLRLLVHPNVRARAPEATADEWIGWCDRLRILHGAHQSDHLGTYIEGDLYNWDQGLKRLALGVFLAGPKSNQDEPIQLGGYSYLPEETAMDRLGSAATLVALSRSLISDARYAQQSSLPLAHWARFFSAAVTAYFLPLNDNDERDRLRILGAISELAALDLTGTPIPFILAAERLRGRLAQLRTHTGQPLADGVAVGPLALLAEIPFKLVFMPGLGEGRFPANEHPSPLDLRQLARRPGDLSARERDQAYFLSRILATRRGLTVSWVARNPHTGDPLEPSPLVVELRHVLERGYLGPGWVQKLPLRRHEPSVPADPLALPASRREARAALLRKDLVAHLGGPPPPPQQLQQQLSSALWRPIGELIGAVDRPAPKTPDAAAKLTLDALQRFLEDPFLGWVEHVLKLRRPEQDLLAEEDERFVSRRWDTERLLLGVLSEALVSPTPPSAENLATLYQNKARILELAGVIPTGVFGASEAQRHTQVLVTWLDALRAILAPKDRLQRLRLGPGRDPLPDAEPVEALRISMNAPQLPAQVALVGTTWPLLEHQTSFGFLIRAPDERDVVRGFLDQVVLSALGRATGAFTLRLIPPDGAAVTHELPFLSAHEAREYLATLAGDLLGQPHHYTLPLKTALALHEAAPHQQEDILERASTRRRFSTLPWVAEALEPPSLADALVMIERRYGPLLSRWHRKKKT